MEDNREGMWRPKQAAFSAASAAIVIILCAILSWGVANSCVPQPPAPTEDNGNGSEGEADPETEGEEGEGEEEAKKEEALEPDHVPKLDVIEPYILLSSSQILTFFNVKNIGVAGVDPEFIWEVTIPPNEAGLTIVPTTGRLGVAQEAQAEVSAENLAFEDTLVLTLTVEARASSNGGTTISRDQDTLDVIIVGAGFHEAEESGPEIDVGDFEDGLPPNEFDALDPEFSEDGFPQEESSEAEGEPDAESDSEIESDLEEPAPSTPTYILSLTTSPPGTSELIELSETEPNDAPIEEGVLNIGLGAGWPIVIATGTLDPAGDADIYAVYLTSSLILLANVDTPNLSEQFLPFLFLLDTDGDTILAYTNETGDLLADLPASSQPYFIAVLNAADGMNEIEEEILPDVETGAEVDAEAQVEAETEAEAETEGETETEATPEAP